MLKAGFTKDLPQISPNTTGFAQAQNEARRSHWVHVQALRPLLGLKNPVHQWYLEYLRMNKSWEWEYNWLGFWRGNPILYFSNLTSSLHNTGHLCRYLVLVGLLHTTRPDVLKVLGRFARQCTNCTLFLIFKSKDLVIRKDHGKQMNITWISDEYHGRSWPEVPEGRGQNPRSWTEAGSPGSPGSWAMHSALCIASVGGDLASELRRISTGFPPNFGTWNMLENRITRRLPGTCRMNETETINTFDQY